MQTAVRFLNLCRTLSRIATLNSMRGLPFTSTIGPPYMQKKLEREKVRQPEPQVFYYLNKPRHGRRRI